MKKGIRKYIRKLLAPLGIDVIRISALEKYKQNEFHSREYNFLLKYPFENIPKYLKHKKSSKSQLKQDLFVLCELNYKRNGYFVELGATDGMSMSNTYLLEKEFGWNGILAEPAKCWHNSLFSNRAVHIEKNCIMSSSGKDLIFKEAKQASLSTIDGYGHEDNHRNARLNGIKYKVKTISLLDLLEKWKAPRTIDYLSIDTEGSEFEILKNFDFNKFKFRILSVEHNFTPQREKIFDLLNANGYKRVHEDFSEFDDWYIIQS